MQGTSKRKRSLDSEPDIENMPVEVKRLRQENGDESEPANDVRPPLAEIPVESQIFGSDDDSSDTEWLEETGALPDTDEEVEPEDKELPKAEIFSSESDIPSPPSPTSDNIVSLFFDTRDHLYSKIHFNVVQFVNLINLLKRSPRARQERSEALFSNNPGLQPRMRSVLLEWIVEVCDVYKLHRETYHLTVDYLDRYLCKATGVAKNQLQLIGVTALFLASKYEEIYPPKLSDFAYITDGACSEKDILRMEKLMVQVLEWRCTIITSNSWLLGFLQLLYYQEKKENKVVDVTKQLYNHAILISISHLLDLCSLDSNFLVFPYKVLALSSVHTVIDSPDPIILQVSGYDVEDLTACMRWMKPFWTVLCRKFSYETITAEAFKASEPRASRSTDFSHMKMKHVVDLDMLESAQKMVEDDIPELLLTPPQSSEKTKDRTSLTANPE